jgi:hypothetical protein
LRKGSKTPKKPASAAAINKPKSRSAFVFIL